MNRHVNPLIIVCFWCVSFFTSVANAEFQFADGDRVVLLGDALIEQEQYFGWVEAMMTTSHADRDVTFRNLGWSGDTPAGQSRFGLSLLQAGREPADEGWKQLVKQLELTKPTVIVFGYGMASGIENSNIGTDAFAAEFKRLIGEAKRITPSVRFVFLSPIQPLNDENPFHESIKDHANVIAALAKQTDSPFVDLSGVARSKDTRKDDIHLNDAGYRELAIAIQKSLGWNSGWDSSTQTESLRQVILRKSTWWFHRSRPANMAYVFGFRKHEQGQNAVEIPKFDALVVEEEKRIADLRDLKPTTMRDAAPVKKSRYAKFTPQPTPEFTMGDDLEVTLWAENPLLNKPIQMNFDPQGRLWVASSEAYPMIEVGQSAPDKILILEDTTGDGKADKSTVFAEDLLIPTGVEPGDGGCYVAQSTDLLFLKDTDGDGKADQKTRVLNGFGTEDTHHNLHTLRWGPDGRLFMNQSIYTRTDAETPRGVMRLKAGGGFRYNTTSMRMEVFFRGLVNSWGHQFDAFGQSFLSDGAGFNGLAYAFPGATFNPTPKARKLMELISPGRYPKFCSAEIIYGDSYPPEWQGSIVTCDFRANRVTRFSLADDGGGFVTKQESDLMRTAAATFRPIDVKQGPDGALYIADWSNPIINHGEVDFRDARRDRWHGRIWRVTWKGAKAKAKQDLTKLANEKLLENLKSNDRYTRDQSRRVLIERKADAAPMVAKWTQQQSTDFAKLQGLWLGQALDVGDHASMNELLKSDDARIRAAAIRVVSDWADPGSDSAHPVTADSAIAIYENAIHDKHARVRLEAIRGLGKLGTAKAASIALDSLDHPRDQFIDYALYLTVNELANPLLQTLQNGDWKPSDQSGNQKLEFVLTSIPPARASEFVASHLAENKISKDGSGPWIDLVGKAGGAQELRALYQQTLAGGFDTAASVRAIRSLINAQRLRKVRPAGGAVGIGKLLSSDQVEIQKAATELAGTWKLQGQVKTLAQIAAKKANRMDARVAAVYAIQSIGNGEAANLLTTIATNGESSELRKHGVIALSRLGTARAAKPFFEVLKTIRSEQEGVDLWRGVMNVKGAGKKLASSIPADGISEIAARAGIRVAREGGRNEPELVAALNPLTGISMTAKKMTPEQLKVLVSKISTGDPHRGEAIYRRKELACISCHAIGGVGGKVGPDMTSLGASAPADYITESLYNPNAKIKENYHSVIVATDDGIFGGIEVSSTDEELVLRDATGKLIKIATDDITGKKNGPSLMPNGVVDRLSQQEQLDLISFLTRLGKPGEFDASKGNVGRVYEIFAGTHRIEQGGAEQIIDGSRKGWKPLTALVSGNVPGETMKQMTAQPINIALVNVYLRTTVQASSDGPVTFKIEGPKQAAFWVNGKRVEGKTEFKTDLKAGKSIVIARLDGRGLPENFKLTSSDVTFLLD